MKSWNKKETIIIYKQLIARAGYKAKLKQMFTEHSIADVIHDINIDYIGLV